MTQNIYDDPGFFDEYARLERSVHGLDGAPEWPALRALLPDLRGLRVLDLGCGYGWFCRWARESGAARVVGIDVSERMLQRARRDYQPTRSNTGAPISKTWIFHARRSISSTVPWRFIT